MSNLEDILDFFGNRTAAFTCFVLFGLVLSSFGVIANSSILLTHFLRFYARDGIEVIAMNLKFTLIMCSMTFIYWVFDETFHVDMLSFKFCNLFQFLEHFSYMSKGSSIVVLIFASRFFSKINRTQGCTIVTIIWILCATFSYPYYKLEIHEFQLSSGSNRTLCVIPIEGDESFYLKTSIVKYVMIYLAPLTILLGSLCVAILCKTTPVSSQNRSMYLYGLVIGFYYTLTHIPNIIYITNYIHPIEISYGFTILLVYLQDLLVIFSPAAYCYFNRVFLVEMLETLKVIRIESNNEINVRCLENDANAYVEISQ